VIPQEWFLQAEQRILSHTAKTPLSFDPIQNLYLKWENHQVTGSFKARGALNKVLSMEPWEREQGLIAASAGNHGQGVALAGRLTSTEVQVFVAKGAVPAKVDAMRRLGAEVTFVSGGYGEAEEAAKAHAADTGRRFISPYNDAQIIAGQGTVALECVRQLRGYGVQRPADVAAWIFPMGGGGLICGCGAALAADDAQARLIGVQPAASAFTQSLLRRGTQEGVRDEVTLADGLSGPIDEGSITIPMMKQLVADVITVTEAQIERAMAFAWRNYGEQIEGSAAVALAAALEEVPGLRPVVVVLTGGNVQPETFKEILMRHGLQATI